MRILMHICCANCAVNPVGELLSDGHALTGLWFNPNIHPEEEYQKRREAVGQLAEAKGIEVIYEGGYGLYEFNEALGDIPPVKPGRCAICYRMRMMKTAELCKEGGYDAFTTSLLISPYQAHDLLRAEAEAAAKEHGVRFYYEDFRPLWKDGQQIARQHGFYRQYYCGCIYSRQERDLEHAQRKKK